MVDGYGTGRQVKRSGQINLSLFAWFHVPCSRARCLDQCARVFDKSRTAETISSRPEILAFVVVAAVSLAKQKPPRKTANPLVRIVDGFKTFKPITPGLRHVRLPVAPHLWKGSPVRALTTPIRKKGGRNSTGRITVRSRGGGHKRRLREIDFYRWATGPSRRYSHRIRPKSVCAHRTGQIAQSVSRTTLFIYSRV
jgi:hypothetical protein